MTDDEAASYCADGLHVRDTVDGTCLECGDRKDPAAESEELRAHEPPTSSIVIANGPHGTAWQRFSSDGMWHSTTGKRAPWRLLMKSDRPGARTRLVYLPPRDSNALEP